MGICDEASHSLLFGVLMGSLAHLLIVWSRTRDRAMLACLGAFALLGLHLAQRLGYPALLSGPGEHVAAGLAASVGLLVGCALIIPLARALLRSAGTMPRIDRGARACLWAGLAAACAQPLLAPAVAASAGAASVCANVLVLSAMAWRGVRDGLAGAASFALAWACLAVVLLALAMPRALVVPPPGLLEAGLGLGVLALLAFTQALAERSRRDGMAREERRCAASQAHVARSAQDEHARLLAGVVNNLRQPLYAATLAAESLRRDHSQVLAGPALARLHEALETADNLLDSTMTVAQLEAGAVRPRIDRFSLDPLLERVDNSFGPGARAKGLRWTVTPCLEQVTTDAHMLQRILFHLVRNAVTYTETGGVLVSCRPRRAGILLQVWDTGGGLPPEPDAQVFERHFRGETGTETDGGVGFGLVIAKRASLLLGLNLSVRSWQGHGACFSLWLPRQGDSAIEDAGVRVQEVQRLSSSGAVVLDALQHERAAMPRD